jgi:DNA-binding NtrC family response regulator
MASDGRSSTNRSAREGLKMQDLTLAVPSGPGPNAEGLKQLMAAYERNLILTALGASGWNQRRAAATLGVLPTTLLEKMRRLGIKNPRRAGETSPTA